MACLFYERLDGLIDVHECWMIPDDTNANYEGIFGFIDTAVKNKSCLILEIDKDEKFKCVREGDVVNFYAENNLINVVVGYMNHVDAEYDVTIIVKRRKPK